MRYLVLLVMFLGACVSDESPKKSAQQFLRAIEEGDREQVYRLLAPNSQHLLAEIASKANAHTGGGRRLLPQDLFAVGQERPALKLGELKVLEIKGDQARVQLEDPKKTRREILKLIRVEGVWRILLPDQATKNRR